MENSLKNNDKILFLALNTWKNDSNSIFDYSSNTIKTIKAYIAHPTYVVKTKNDFFINIEQHADIQNKDGDELIFHVKHDINNIYNLANPIPNNLKLKENNFDYLNNKIWYILKTIDLENHDSKPNSNEEYYLNENDIIKIGKVKYAVQKIHLLGGGRKNNYQNPPMIPVIESQYRISDLNKNLKPVFEFIFQVKDFNDPLKINQENHDLNETILFDKYQCKYCKNNNIYEDNYNDKNYLIKVCECKDLVHFKCLKNHLKTLRKKNNENITKYDEVLSFRNFQCSKCKNQYPIKFKLPNNNKVFNLIDIKEPTDCNYMILESIDYKQNGNYSKSIHIIKFLKKNGEPFTIGSNNDNDIIDKDVAISSYHAILRFNDWNGQICIQNWNSVFGTSILIRKSFTILDKKIYLQVGKTYIEANLMKRKDYFEEINNCKVIILN